MEGIKRLVCFAGLMAGLLLAMASAHSAPKTILVMGDSLSAEYGLARDSGWIKLLEKRLAQKKISATVANASISGETTSGGRSRLPALLKQHQPSHVVIELAGNDGLRGLSLTSTTDNLRTMIVQSKKAGAQVLLIGMQLPPNYGPDYTRRFTELFTTLAKEEKVALVPFLLEGFGQKTNMFQPDRIHPTAQAQLLMLDNVWPVLHPLLQAP